MEMSMVSLPSSAGSQPETVFFTAPSPRKCWEILDFFASSGYNLFTETWN
jgi:hypothetical protein